MITEEQYLPIIQKTEDDKYVHINEDCFARHKGQLVTISIEEFNKKTKGKEFITWDGN